MSRPLSPIVCDGPGCTAQKREANHWWVVAVFKHPRSVLIQVWSPEARTQAQQNARKRFWDIHDMCGTSCALKFISEQMGKAAVAVQSPGDHQESNPGSQGGQNNA